MPFRSLLAALVLVSVSGFGATRLECSDQGFTIAFEAATRSVQLSHRDLADAFFKATEVNVHNDTEESFPSFTASGTARFPHTESRRTTPYEGRVYMTATPSLNNRGRVSYKLNLQVADNYSGGLSILPALLTTKCRLSR